MHFCCLLLKQRREKKRGKKGKTTQQTFFFFFFKLTHCGAFIQKHASVITTYFLLTHPHFFASLMFFLYAVLQGTSNLTTEAYTETGSHHILLINAKTNVLSVTWVRK